MNLGNIRSLAEEFLIDAKLIQNEEGADVYRIPLDRMVELSKKADKTELARMSNAEIFLIFVHLFNGHIYSYYETKSAVEEIKDYINSWTIDKNGKDLRLLVQNMDEQGNLTNYQATMSFMNLNLTSGFFNYNMQSVYECMHCFLKFRNNILNPPQLLKNGSINQKHKYHKATYKDSFFDRYVDHAAKTIEKDAENHEFRKQIATLRIGCLNDLLDRIEDQTLTSFTEIPDEWHKYLPAEILEPIYEIILNNLKINYEKLEETEKTLKKQINKTSLTTYLYSKGLNPNSLSDTKTNILEGIPNIVEYLKFLEELDITPNNALTTYYELLINLTDEKILFIKKLLGEKALSNETLKENMHILGSSYEIVKNNYEILKPILDFNNIFYKDTLLLRSLKDIKIIIDVLSKYELSKNNYIFLLCNYEYLNIYDLVIENSIPTELFISICKTSNPLNTIKRILIYKSIEEPFQTPNGYLKKDVTSSSKFICEDSELDSYLPNVTEEHGLNLLKGTAINKIESNPIVVSLDQQFLRYNSLYIIGGTKISRPKFLRNFESVKGNPNYLITSLVSNSILDAPEYYNLTSTLNSNQLKK